MRYGTLDTCNQLLATSCNNGAMAPSTGSSTTTVDACTQVLPDWQCSDFINYENTPPACKTAVGSLPLGATCSVKAQCQTAFCAVVDGNACGVCSALPTVGSSCAQTQCPSGLSSPPLR